MYKPRFISVTSDKYIRNVKICGPKDDIENITAGELYAVADLSGKSAGTYTVDVIIKSDDYDKVWQVGSYSVAVNIK